MGRHPTAKMTERAAVDTLVLFCIVANLKTKNPLTLGYQSDHLLLTEDLMSSKFFNNIDSPLIQKFKGIAENMHDFYAFQAVVGYYSASFYKFINLLKFNCTFYSVIIYVCFVFSGIKCNQIIITQ